MVEEDCWMYVKRNKAVFVIMMHHPKLIVTPIEKVYSLSIDHHCHHQANLNLLVDYISFLSVSEQIYQLNLKGLRSL